MDINKALSKCMQLCSRREYCNSEIIEKLNTWEVATENHNKIIEKLTQEKFIDHNRYAQAFVNDKFKFNNWGKVKIKYHLKQKQIEDSVINKHLNDIDPTAYELTLKTEINKKIQTTKANSYFEKNQKVARYAISKGFEPSLVFDLLKTYE